MAVRGNIKMKEKKSIGIALIVIFLVFAGALGLYGRKKGAEAEGLEVIPTPVAVSDSMTINEPIPIPSQVPTSNPVITNSLVSELETVNPYVPVSSVVPVQNADITNASVPEPSDMPTFEPVITNISVPDKIATPTLEPVAANTPVPALTAVPTSTKQPTPINTPKPSKPTNTPRPTATPFPTYNPEEYGYTERVGEWKYGEDITATLWWNGIKWENDGKACVLVFEGTGETWTKEESNRFYNRTSCPWIGFENYAEYIYEAVIGEGITKISYLQLPYAKHIILPNSINEIGKHALSASKIVSIVIPKGVKRIEDYAFYCSELTSVVIPEGVEYIGTCAFDRCHLTEINLPDSLKFIGSAAFGIQHIINAEENQVSEVVIPAGVEKIGFGAFIGRYGMKIYLEGKDNDADFDKGWNDDGFNRKIEVIYNYKKE